MNPAYAYDYDSAIGYVNRSRAARMCGVGKDSRAAICRAYVDARSMGASHKVAKQWAPEKAGFGPIWIYLAWIGLQVLFALLKKWWDAR